MRVRCAGGMADAVAVCIFLVLKPNGHFVGQVNVGRGTVDVAVVADKQDAAEADGDGATLLAADVQEFAGAHCEKVG